MTGRIVFRCTEGHLSTPTEQRILVPTRVRTVCYERLEVPRDRRRRPFTSRWQSLEILEERPYCAAHAAAVTPTTDPASKLIHLPDHLLPPGWFEA